MINFRQKTKHLIKNMMPEAIEHLNKCGIRPNMISLEDSDKVSKVNSKAMVIREFIQTEDGSYQIKVQDKEAYSYTEKLLGSTFKLNVTDVDKKNRITTASTENLGIMLDAIEILGWKYNLSVVNV